MLPGKLPKESIQQLNFSRNRPNRVIEIDLNSNKVENPEKIPGVWLGMLSDEIDCRKAVGINPNLLRLQHFDEIDKMGAKCMSNMMRIASGLNKAQREEWLPIQIGRFLEHVLNETDPKKKLSLYACHDLTRKLIHTVLPSYTGSTLKNSIPKSTFKVGHFEEKEKILPRMLS